MSKRHGEKILTEAEPSELTPGQDGHPSASTVWVDTHRCIATGIITALGVSLISEQWICVWVFRVETGLL